MLPAQMPRINPDGVSRCEERRPMTDHERILSPIDKVDAAMEESIYHALWKDVVLRAIEYEEFDVHVKNGVVYLYGHVVSTTAGALAAVFGVALSDVVHMRVRGAAGDPAV